MHDDSFICLLLKLDSIRPIFLELILKFAENFEILFFKVATDDQYSLEKSVAKKAP